MKKVFICSPFRGPQDRNRLYAIAAMRDCFARGEAPIVVHLLYPYVLDDNDEVEREKAFAAASGWLACADLVAVYQDYGVTEGMLREIGAATCQVEYRAIREEQLVREDAA